MSILDDVVLVLRYAAAATGIGLALLATIVVYCIVVEWMVRKW